MRVPLHPLVACLLLRGPTVSGSHLHSLSLPTPNLSGFPSLTSSLPSYLCSLVSESLPPSKVLPCSTVPLMVPTLLIHLHLLPLMCSLLPISGRWSLPYLPSLLPPQSPYDRPWTLLDSPVSVGLSRSHHPCPGRTVSLSRVSCCLLALVSLPVCPELSCSLPCPFSDCLGVLLCPISHVVVLLSSCLAVRRLRSLTCPPTETVLVFCPPPGFVSSTPSDNCLSVSPAPPVSVCCTRMSPAPLTSLWLCQYVT